MAQKDTADARASPETLSENSGEVLFTSPGAELELPDTVTLLDKVITPHSGATLKRELNCALTDREISQTLNLVGESIKYNYSILSVDGAVVSGRYEQIQKTITNTNTIALGDLHGSYQKLFETLVVTGLASMPKESAQRYLELSQQLEDLVSNNPHFDEALLEPEKKGPFKKILDKIYKPEEIVELTPLEKARQLQEEIIGTIKTMSWTGKEEQKLILIGDVIADRGISDRITLELLSHVSKQTPERIIRLASNHDQAGLHFLLTGETSINHQESQTRAFQLTKREDYDALGELYLEHLSQLKLMHFEPETKTLYTHAPITKDNILALIDNLKTENLLDINFSYHDISSENILEFVEAANLFYKEVVTFPIKNGLNVIDDIADKTLNDDQRGFLWSRSNLPAIEELPLYTKGVNILVHGHDSSSIQGSPYSVDQSKDSGFGIACLDGDVRKLPGYQGKDNCRLFIS